MEKVPQIVSARLRTAAAEANRPDANHLDASHPDADVLTAFAEKSLLETERAQVMDHLALCGDCRDVLALALPATESMEQVMVPSRGSWFSWPVLRWGFAAAGLAVIATFGVVQYERSSRPVGQPVAKFAEPAATAMRSNAAGPESRPTSMTDAAANQGPVAAPTLTAPAVKLPALKQRVAEREKKAVDVPAPQVAESAGHVQSGEASTTSTSMASASAPSSGMVRTVPPPRAALHGGVTGGNAGGSLSGTTTANAAFGPKMPAQWQQNTGNNVNGMAAQAPATTVSAKNQTVLVSGAAQAVEVSSEVAGPAATVATDNLRLRAANEPAPKISDKDVESLSKAKPAQAATTLGGPMVPGTIAGPRWTISSTGRLQRSVDHGNTWQDVDVTANPGTTVEYEFMAKAGYAKSAKQATNSPAAGFRAVTANGPEVWAGGRAGLLYHSADAGGHWTRVVPTANGMALTEDIVSVEFSDAQHGSVKTTSAMWTTADGGQNWLKQ